MKRILHRSEIVNETEVDGHAVEVIASGIAEYDEINRELCVELEAHLRVSDPEAAGKRMEADWLPLKEMVRERMAWEEALAGAKDIFDSWARRIGRAHSNTNQT